ncbi:MAG TPA: DUF1553 domain-containing protein [Bryobacteraceae bacterium]|nr:DUF1553 domain-containing protein [Bryobacteraceae bacterium]
MKLRLLVFLPLFAALGSSDDLPSNVSGANCTFQASPDRFLSVQGRIREQVSQTAQRFQQRAAAMSIKPAAATAPIAHRNFIDDQIFNALSNAKVQPANLTTDEEFFRRINFDLTGRIPAAADVSAFTASTDPGKRDAAIEQLLNSPAFNDKWTLWLGDLLQNNVAQATAAVNRQIAGRNAFYGYLYWSVAGWKPLNLIAYESISGAGENYDLATGSSNFIMGGSVTGGPAQDTYDGMLVRSATSFLGMSHYDCLLCHNGRGHLDQISLWGSQTTRTDAESMAAFFARTRLTRYPAADTSDSYYNSSVATDAVTTAGYDLNTNYGNRPNRVPVGTTKTLTPVYQSSGATPSDGNWRNGFAWFLINDPMFARNMSNRLWKAMFNLGLVDPVDQMDPARLDPNNPPAAPWTLQAANPVLLEKLANYLANSNWDLRGFLRLIAQSSAYQLSSRYDGNWNIQYVPLFARHYPRRLDAEEIHDAISSATGVFNKYTVQGFGDPVQWAMQLPDTSEPRSNGAVANFLNSFLRGNRDTTQRSQASSILQQLNLMNDNFVVSRTRVAASPALLAISKLTDNASAVEQLFLTFLSREPTDYERAHALTYLQNASSAAARSAAIEDLAWACINKLDFLFSY